ncbi:hypothetical protein JQK87_35055 [Streptomyces sp. G44]|uniref:hypothetical protein n=1 Tax=Streptomyces sp. G44 TaxID=2807632 RepID=UPI00196036ED|nr:hypothetical protein [Streptomyces sp. G44]MBM7173517.1 hypothetical protein [Streptomyces sp. G44]
MNPALTRAVTLGAGLLLVTSPLAAASALASPSDTPPGPVTKAAPRATLSAKATAGSTRAWQQFRVHGASTHLRAGTRVTLQQLQHKKWVRLPAQMNTSRAHTYNLRVKLGLKGANKLRVVGGGAVSNVVRINVR